MTAVAVKLKDGRWVNFDTDSEATDTFNIAAEVTQKLINQGISTHLVEEIIAN
jgi:hypothetical protein